MECPALEQIREPVAIAGYQQTIFTLPVDGVVTLSRRSSDSEVVVKLCPPTRWSLSLARSYFRILAWFMTGEEEMAYAALVRLGCPLDLADNAWDHFVGEETNFIVRTR